MNTPTMIILAIYLVNLIVPIILGMVCFLVWFWSRGRVSLPWYVRLQNFKYGYANDIEEALLLSFVLDLFMAGLLTAALAAACTSFGYAPIFILLAVGVLVFAPRVVADIAHSIRYSFKDKEAARLADLESEVAKLKGEQG